MDTSVSPQLDSSLNHSMTDGESHGEDSPPPQVHTRLAINCAGILTDR